jgi:3-O-methylgallate 3,4-dioxygenase
VDTELGLHLIEYLIEAEFDVAHSRYISEESGGTIGPAGYIKNTRTTKSRPMGMPHGPAFVIRRLMDNRPTKIVNILQNTFYPPNSPTPKRAYDFGKALRSAVEAWNTDKRVAVVASGGLSHFVVDEEIDQLTIEACREKSPAKVAALPRHKLLAGTSENKDWLVTAGASEHLKFELVEYIAAYRSPAGTGHADGFAVWR